MSSTIAWSRSSGTFMTSAMASRVMSSWVGPSPPHTMTPSLRASAVRSASVMRSWLSPTAWWKCEATPLAARCSPSQAELVSAIWPEQQLGADRHDLDPHGGRPYGVDGAWRAPPAVEQVLGAGEERERAGEPDHGDLEVVLVGQRRDDAGADGEVLDERLELGRVAGGDRRRRGGRPRSGRAACRPRGP